MTVLCFGNHPQIHTHTHTHTNKQTNTSITHSFANPLPAEIVSWSLAQQAQHQQPEQKYLSFTIHDIILDYLKTTIGKEDQEAYHATMVDRLDITTFTVRAPSLLPELSSSQMCVSVWGEVCYHGNQE